MTVKEANQALELRLPVKVDKYWRADGLHKSFYQVKELIKSFNEITQMYGYSVVIFDGVRTTYRLPIEYVHIAIEGVSKNDGKDSAGD